MKDTKVEVGTTHITPAGGNVFADLGFSADEAKALKAESLRRINNELAIKDSTITKDPTRK